MEDSKSAPSSPAIGVRFSQNYLKSEPTLNDSTRARRRLFVLFDVIHRRSEDYVTPLVGKTGTKVPSHAYGPSWATFFETAKLRDVLDAVTVFWTRFNSGSRSDGERWLKGVREVFSEESLGYRVDDLGGVHLLVDQEFQRDRSSTLLGLGASRFAAAQAAFDACHGALDKSPPSTTDAVRGIFDALENVFKLIAGGKAARLGASEIDQYLAPIIARRYDGPALNYANRLLASFKDWTNGAHQYRHAPGTEQPSPPPLDLTVLAVSTGTNFLRWLLELDTEISGGA